MRTRPNFCFANLPAWQPANRPKEDQFMRSSIVDDVLGQAGTGPSDVGAAPIEPFNWRNHLPAHPAADLFPALSDEELRALAEDIKARGLLANIVVWCPDGNTQNEALLDGRQRLDALAMLGLLRIDHAGSLAFTKTWGGNKWFDGAGRRLEHNYHLGGDPYALALSYNVHRRHLTNDQKRDLIAKVLKAKPEQSNRVIAEQVKASHKTVADVRREKEATGEIPQLKKTVGADGKARKSTKPTKAPKAKDEPKPAKSNGINAKPLPDIVDICVAVVCRRVEDTVVEIQNHHKHESRRKLEHLFAALGDAIIDLGHKVLPPRPQSGKPFMRPPKKTVGARNERSSYSDYD
jgi:ParB-like chromosome segregation protein Spo0J